MEETVTLARFVARSGWEDIPERVRHEGRRTLVNFLGCALGGCRDAAIEHCLAVLAPFSGPAQTSVIGRGRKLDLLSAAFVNAASANVFDFDDTHLPTVIHPAAPVAPAALGLAENAPASGAELLHAVILGIEVECRVGNAVTPWHYSRGWHITSTCGVIGAAAAAAKLLKLDEEQTVRAIALGANQACGLIESLGTMAKSVSVGNAPRNGLVAALLARHGFSASPVTLEGPRGFANVLGEKPDLACMTKQLGEEWEAAKNTYKPYPCGIVLHPVIDAFLTLREKHSLKGHEVQKIVVIANPLLRQRADRPRPSSGREAQVSLQHTAAVCLLRGAAGLAEYSDAAAADAVLAAFGERVRLVDDAAMPVEAARVELHTADGRRLASEVSQALGSLARPMSDAELEAKARSLAACGAPQCNVPRLLDAAWRIDKSADAGELARLAC